MLVIHHSRKSGTSEGSTALRGAVDVIIKCGGSEEGQVQLTCEKMKDAEPSQTGSLGLAKVHLRSGRSSLVLKGWKEVVLDKVPAGSGWCSQAVEILRAQFRRTTFQKWNTAFKEKTGKSKSTFVRAIEDAAKRGLIRQEGTGQGATTKPSRNQCQVSNRCQSSAMTPARGCQCHPHS